MKCEYNARGILFVDDLNHTRFFQYHKIPISGSFLKVTSERDIPVKNFIVTLFMFVTSPKILSPLLSTITSISSIIISEFIAFPEWLE
jgi:hypothetical protein